MDAKSKRETHAGNPQTVLNVESLGLFCSLPSKVQWVVTCWKDKLNRSGNWFVIVYHIGFSITN